MRDHLNFFLEIIGLHTPRGRILFFVAVSIAIFLTPYSFLAGLSLWQKIGIDAPSVGLTRAYWHVLHLDFVQAWVRNPLIFAVIAVGVPLLVRDAHKLFFARKA
jgi:hypothetical protein